MTPLRDTWRLSATAFTTHPILWGPFVLAALVEAVLIGLVWAAPHPPFSAVLAPVIRYFFGEANLHYPTHLWFLYFAMKYTSAAATLLSGAALGALACVLMEQAYWGVPISVRSALASRRIHYGRVAAAWAASWLFAKLVMDAFMRVAPHTPVALAAGIVLSVVIQAAFGYAIPLTVYQGCSWWRALLRSAREALRYPVSTLAVTVLASAPFIAWALCAPSTRVAEWMRTTPEIAVGFVAARWVITAASDAFLTIGLATLWWVHKDGKKLLAIAGGKGQRAGGARRRSKPSLAPRPSPHAPLVILCLLLGGCSVNYEGERQSWKARQAHAEVLRDPAGATEEGLAQAIAAFERIAEQARGTEWAAHAHLTVANLRAARREFPEARARYERVIREYDQFAPLCLQARIALASSLEADGRWEEAIRLYEELPLRHPWTVPALEAPVYVAGVYERHGRPREAAARYTQAVEEYLKWVMQAPTPELAAAAKGYLALTHERRGEWRDAIKILEELAHDPAEINRPFVLMTLASLYQTRAQDPERAQQAYSELLARYKDHPLASEAKTRLEHLGIGLVPSDAPEHGS